MNTNNRYVRLHCTIVSNFVDVCNIFKTSKGIKTIDKIKGCADGWWDTTFRAACDIPSRRNILKAVPSQLSHSSLFLHLGESVWSLASAEPPHLTLWVWSWEQTLITYGVCDSWGKVTFCHTRGVFIWVKGWCVWGASQKESTAWDWSRSWIRGRTWVIKKQKQNFFFKWSLSLCDRSKPQVESNQSQSDRNVSSELHQYLHA